MKPFVILNHLIYENESAAALERRLKMDIELLINKSKHNDIQAFMGLLKEKQELFYKIAFTYTKNSFDAEDCISEAAIKAYEKLKQLRDSKKFYSWFTSILVNVCRDHHRQNKRLASEEELIDIVDSFSYASIEDRLFIENLLNILKNDDREVLVLRYLKDYSIKEISEIMGIPVNTVKSKIHRSLNLLRLKNGRVTSEF